MYLQKSNTKGNKRKGQPNNRYRIIGKGPALFVVNANFPSVHDFQLICDLLANFFTIYAHYKRNDKNQRVQGWITICRHHTMFQKAKPC